MLRFRKNNGITEGFHIKMEMISKRAYGFRNFENYRLRVLTHCGWDGIINGVRMNAHPPSHCQLGEPSRILNGLSWSFDVFQNGAQERALTIRVSR
jgi:hypothetical protein